MSRPTRIPKRPLILNPYPHSNWFECEGGHILGTYHLNYITKKKECGHTHCNRKIVHGIEKISAPASSKTVTVTWDTVNVRGQAEKLAILDAKMDWDLVEGGSK
jgi:hypothetical protein